MKILLWMTMIFVVACSDNDQAANDSSTVLATVNGKSITENQLDTEIKNTFGEKSGITLKSSARKKFLENLVLNQVILEEAEKQLANDKRQELEEKAKRYRDQMLIKAYLQQEAPPQQINQEMVAEYYEENLQRFGAKVVRQYEMLSSSVSNGHKQYAEILKIMEHGRQNNSWRILAGQLAKNGIGIRYSKGDSGEKTLPSQLKDVLDALVQGNSSEVIKIKGKLYLLRVTGEKLITAKPLSEVSSTIRQALVPIQLKKSLEQVSEQLLHKADIQYSKE